MHDIVRPLGATISQDRQICERYRVTS